MFENTIVCWRTSCRLFALSVLCTSPLLCFDQNFLCINCRSIALSTSTIPRTTLVALLLLLLLLVIYGVLVVLWFSPISMFGYLGAPLGLVDAGLFWSMLCVAVYVVFWSSSVSCCRACFHIVGAACGVVNVMMECSGVKVSSFMIVFSFVKCFIIFFYIFSTPSPTCQHRLFLPDPPLLSAMNAHLLCLVEGFVQFLLVQSIDPVHPWDQQ